MGCKRENCIAETKKVLLERLKGAEFLDTESKTRSFLHPSAMTSHGWTLVRRRI
jgi:hypothetical protein